MAGAYFEHLMADEQLELVLAQKRMYTALVDAAKKGIAVANVDTQVTNLKNVIIQITGNNADGGAKAADAIAKAIGYTKGGSYEVVIGLTSPTATTNVGRQKGFETAVS